MDEKRHGAEGHICEDCWNDVSKSSVLKRLTDCEGTPNYLPDGLLVDTIAMIKRQFARFKAACELHELAENDLRKAYEELARYTEAKPVAEGIEEAAIALMQAAGGPGVPHRAEARVAIEAYLRVVAPKKERDHE